MGNIAKSFLTKQYPAALGTSRITSFGQGARSRQGKEQYLRSYSEISWLRAAVSLIAQSVAQIDWSLYRRHKDGEREEVTGQHDLKDLINRPNPFQSGHDLFELHQIFDELIGEVYWTKQRDSGSNELWIVPPQFMTVIPDPKKYISGYHFERGDFRHDFRVDEIIPFIEPNPMDSLIGSGRAQSVGIDLETLSFLSQANRNWFYWGSPAGTVISYPPEAAITPDEIDRLSEQWGAAHRSYGRAHKTAILTQGATVQNAEISSRDMDYSALAKYDREAILGVFGVSFSMIGGTENVIRANAEAQLLNFARWVIVPRLIRIREKLNMFLTPDYGADLELDFDNPTPEDTAQQALEVDNHVKTGIYSIEEARTILDIGEIDPAHHFFVPINLQIMTGEEMISTEPEPPPPQLPPPVAPPPVPPPPEEGKSIKKKALDETTKEAFWAAYVKQAEAYEPRLIKSLRAMYKSQKTEALRNVKDAVDRNHKLIDKDKATKAYREAASPTLTEVILKAAENAVDLIEPENPHKQGIPPVLNRRALDWLLTRIGWAAEQTSEETANLLAEALGEGFGKGESIQQIAQRVQSVFDECSRVRALRIARTEIITASSQGALAGYEEAGLKQVEFYTALDERTCEICMSLHGEIFNVEDALNLITGTTHPNCRCLLLPVLK